jgi:hypothetical protein
MLDRQIVLSLLVTMVLALGSPAYAWNRTGHLISAAVAYDAIERERPDVLLEIDTILQQHPAAVDWTSWQTEFPDIAAAKVRFMLAAVFPDEVRRGSFKAYDRPDWHYINHPVRAGQSRVDVRTTAPVTGRALDALSAQLTLFRDASRPAGERAVALSWVLHLVGDLAQPLHVGTLVNADFPNGDRGGNDVYVRGSERAQNPVRLHQIWDDGAGGNSLDLRDTAARASQWATAVLPAVRDVDGLVELSYRLADEVVYQSGRLRYARVDQAEAPVLPEGYTKGLQAVAREQIVIAGRLIAVLLAERSAIR